MKNIIILGLFFLGVGVLYAHYFVPNVEKPNNIDQLAALLKSARETIQPGQKVYFLSEENALANPEIYYKVQFALVPRVLVVSKYSSVPSGSYMIQVRDKKQAQTLAEYPFKDKQITHSDPFFDVTLLKKTP